MSLIHEIRPGSTAEITYLNAFHERTCIKVDYVGCIASELLIFNLASNKESQNELKVLKAGKVMDVRVIVGRDNLTVLSFQCSLISIHTIKVPLLIVNYPAAIKQRKLRSEPRLKVELMAEFQIVDAESNHLAMITDISKSGIRCEYLPTEREVETAKIDTLDKLVEQQVVIEFPPIEEHLTATCIKGHIKNIKGREKLTVGIQFCDNELESVKKLYASLLMKEFGL